MADDINTTTNSITQKSEAAPLRRSRVAYFGTAITSGMSSVLLGSIVCVTLIYAFRGDAVGFTEYLIILLMWCMYSAAVILPVSVIIAFPLMVVFRNKGKMTKFFLSMAAGTICTMLCAMYVYLVMPGGTFKVIEALGIGITYGAVFGMVAAQLPRRQTGKII